MAKTIKKRSRREASLEDSERSSKKKPVLSQTSSEGESVIDHGSSSDSTFNIYKKINLYPNMREMMEDLFKTEDEDSIIYEISRFILQVSLYPSHLFLGDRIQT